MIWPHQYEVLFALVNSDEPRSARALFDAHYRRKPAYQRWTPGKVGGVLSQLRKLGLVDAFDEPKVRVWAPTLKGHAFVNGDFMDEAIERLVSGE